MCILKKKIAIISLSLVRNSTKIQYITPLTTWLAFPAAAVAVVNDPDLLKALLALALLLVAGLGALLDALKGHGAAALSIQFLIKCLLANDGNLAAVALVRLRPAWISASFVFFKKGGRDGVSGRCGWMSGRVSGKVCKESQERACVSVCERLCLRVCVCGFKLRVCERAAIESLCGIITALMRQGRNTSYQNSRLAVNDGFVSPCSCRVCRCSQKTLQRKQYNNTHSSNSGHDDDDDAEDDGKMQTAAVKKEKCGCCCGMPSLWARGLWAKKAGRNVAVSAGAGTDWTCLGEILNFETDRHFLLLFFCYFYKHLIFITWVFIC